MDGLQSSAWDEASNEPLAWPMAGTRRPAAGKSALLLARTEAWLTADAA